jgi:3-hydroxyacyl-[acyl-carrier-protein] dehydratase
MMNELVQGIRAAALDAVSCDENGMLTRRYRFDKNFAGFAGHFPNYPVLPAIVEILTVVTLVSEHSGIAMQLAAVEDAKFLAQIRPDQEILVQCCHKSIRGKLLHDAKLSVAGTPAASFLLALRSEGEDKQ